MQGNVLLQSLSHLRCQLPLHKGASDVAEAKKEMTLDRIFTHTIKGHFCSFLVSNIFLNPHFLLSTL